MIFYKRIFLCAVVAVFFISGCNSPVYNQTEKNVADVQIRIDESLKKSDAAIKAPALVVNEGVYVDKTPINLARRPSWLKNHTIIRGDQLPFSYYSRTISSGGGHNVLTRYQVGLDEAIKVSLDYNGTVEGALDLLAAKTGYVYSVNGNYIYWQAFVSKTFDVAFMPGSSDYMMGKTAGNGNISSVSSGGVGGSTVVSAIIDDSAAAQYSNLKASLSVWKDLEATIKQLLSPAGTVIVSESTTTVTVRDKPTNVALVGKYIANLNHKLTKQVLVKVQILDVALENDFNYGINWDAMKRTLNGTNFFLNMDFGTPVSVIPLSGAGTPHEFGVQGSGTSSVTAIITALNQQGKTSIVTEPRVVCLNNQVSVIRIVKQTGYLASVQTTTLSGSSTGGASITSQITPGNVVAGLTLYILPKILDNKIYLQVNADISNVDSIQTINSASGDVASTDDTPVSGSSIIQVPNVTQKQFNQRSVIGSGETLILAGYRQLQNTANAMQLLTSQALGGKGSTQQTHETVVLITPIILHGFA